LASLLGMVASSGVAQVAAGARRSAIVATQQDSIVLTVAEDEKPPSDKECKEATDWSDVQKCLPYRKRVLFGEPAEAKKVVTERPALLGEGPPAVLPSSLPLSLGPTPTEEAEHGKARAMRELEFDQQLQRRDVEEIRDLLRAQ
jgi:hypothetical protein